METFKFENGRVQAFDFKNLTIGEIIAGPYVMRFSCQGFNTNIYYCGHDDALWRRMLEDGKWAIHIAGLFDNLTHSLFYYGTDLRNEISQTKFSELKDYCLNGSLKNNHLKKPTIIKKTDTFIDNLLD